MDYSPWIEREIWSFFESSGISETGGDTPTKISAHELDINPYLHGFFEPIKFFDDHGNLAVFESGISKTREATPTKIVVHALDTNLYLHKFFEPIPID